MKTKVLLVSLLLLSPIASCTTRREIVSTTSQREEKYVCAERVYDIFYNHKGAEADELVIDCLPSLRFKRDESGDSYSLEGKENLGKMSAIYIGDFNYDGFDDVCFHRTVGPSSQMKRQIRIYDCHNDQIIYETSTDESWVLDLDEGGLLLGEQLGGMLHGYGFHPLLSVGRFLHGKTGELEPCEPKLKIKTMYLYNPFLQKGDEFVVNKNEQCILDIKTNSVGTEESARLIGAGSFKVESSDVAFSYEIQESNKTMEFSFACIFQTEGKRTIKISLGGVSAEATFKVVSKGS
jgi:hypothetical protein